MRSGDTAVAVSFVSPGSVTTQAWIVYGAVACALKLVTLT